MELKFGDKVLDKLNGTKGTFVQKIYYPPTEKEIAIVDYGRLKSNFMCNFNSFEILRVRNNPITLELYKDNIHRITEEYIYLKGE